MPLSKEWQLQDAKNRFSEVVRLAQSAPQTVTIHGTPSAVILSIENYRALSQPKISLLEMMGTAPDGFDELIYERSCDSDMREVAF